MLTALLSTASLLASVLATPFYATSLTAPSLFKRVSSGCGTSGQLSCHNTTSQTNTCCFETPGGLLLQTQFWDYSPSTGPTDSWTIHGLWPDHCDGTYSENCDSSRDYTGISSLLTAQGASSTLAFMETCWKNDPNDGSDEEFWEHEWATHGTCYSTLSPSCLPSGSPKGAEAVAFFETVVNLFQTLPTYTWLANQGITPSSSKTYTLSQIQSALKAESGYTPQLDCTSSALNQISWYFNLRGSVIDGDFVPINTIETGSCPSSGIKYPPKTGSSGGCSGSGGGGGGGGGDHDHHDHDRRRRRGGGSGSLPGKATMVASTTGGLLSAGTWSTQTLATYTLSGTASSFTMTTSKGACGVSGGTLACGSGVGASAFSAVSSGGSLLLAYGGSTSFSSTATPSGSTVETVYTGSSESKAYTLVITST